MKRTINVYDFRNAFYKMGRKEQFSYDGLEILFNYIEEVEQDTGEEMELDVIALCCDYAESTIDELISAHDIDISDCDPDDDEAIEETVLGYMNDHTTVCGVVCGVTSVSSIVYAQF